jgi:hypothetical protein
MTFSRDGFVLGEKCVRRRSISGAVKRVSTSFSWQIIQNFHLVIDAQAKLCLQSRFIFAKMLDAKAYSQRAVPFEVVPTLVDTETRSPSGKDDKARSEFSEMKIQVVHSR